MSGHDAVAWEYLLRQHLDETELNRLGEEGWELVAVAGDACYLRRPRLGLKERVTLDQRRSYEASREGPEREDPGAAQ